ncbi:zinc finger protein [Trichonephila clavipes]|nr:zinc finger protein [Trichonephila clavipes]
MQIYFPNTQDSSQTYTILYNIYTFKYKSLAIRLTFAERSFLTLADGAKYSLSCREQITHFLNFYTLVDGAHKIFAFLVERKSPSPDIHTALTGGAHRYRLLTSSGKSRLPLAWHSHMRSASDQSALPPRVLEGSRVHYSVSYTRFFMAPRRKNRRGKIRGSGRPSNGTTTPNPPV